MRVVAFLIYFLVLCFKGDKSVAASVFNNSDNFTHSGRLETSHSTITALLFGSTQLRESKDTEAEFLLSDEVVDEDPTSCFSIKYKLLARRLILQSELSVTKYLQRYCKTPPSSSGLISYKYLLQRALRI